MCYLEHHACDSEHRVPWQQSGLGLEAADSRGIKQVQRHAFKACASVASRYPSMRCPRTRFDNLDGEGSWTVNRTMIRPCGPAARPKMLQHCHRQLLPARAARPEWRLGNEGRIGNSPPEAGRGAQAWHEADGPDRGLRRGPLALRIGSAQGQERGRGPPPPRAASRRCAVQLSHGPLAARDPGWGPRAGGP